MAASKSGDSESRKLAVHLPLAYFLPAIFSLLGLVGLPPAGVPAGPLGQNPPRPLDAIHRAFVAIEPVTTMSGMSFPERSEFPGRQMQSNRGD